MILGMMAMSSKVKAIVGSFQSTTGVSIRRAISEVGFGFRFLGFGFRFSVFGSRVCGFEFRVSVFGLRVCGFEFWVSVFGLWLRVSGFGFHFWGCGFGFRSSGFGVPFSSFGLRVSFPGLWFRVVFFLFSFGWSHFVMSSMDALLMLLLHRSWEDNCFIE